MLREQSSRVQITTCLNKKGRQGRKTQKKQCGSNSMLREIKKEGRDAKLKKNNAEVTQC